MMQVQLPPEFGLLPTEASFAATPANPDEPQPHRGPTAPPSAGPAAAAFEGAVAWQAASCRAPTLGGPPGSPDEFESVFEVNPAAIPGGPPVLPLYHRSPYALINASNPSPFGAPLPPEKQLYEDWGPADAAACGMAGTSGTCASCQMAPSEMALPPPYDPIAAEVHSGGLPTHLLSILSMRLLASVPESDDEGKDEDEEPGNGSSAAATDDASSGPLAPGPAGSGIGSGIGSEAGSPQRLPRGPLEFGSPSGAQSRLAVVVRGPLAGGPEELLATSGGAAGEDSTPTAAPAVAAASNGQEVAGGSPTPRVGTSNSGSSSCFAQQLSSTSMLERTGSPETQVSLEVLLLDDSSAFARAFATAAAKEAAPTQVARQAPQQLQRIAEAAEGPEGGSQHRLDSGALPSDLDGGEPTAQQRHTGGLCGSPALSAMDGDDLPRPALSAGLARVARQPSGGSASANSGWLGSGSFSGSGRLGSGTISGSGRLGSGSVMVSGGGNSNAPISGSSGGGGSSGAGVATDEWETATQARLRELEEQERLRAVSQAAAEGGAALSAEEARASLLAAALSVPGRRAEAEAALLEGRSSICSCLGGCLSSSLGDGRTTSHGSSGGAAASSSHGGSRLSSRASSGVWRGASSWREQRIGLLALARTPLDWRDPLHRRVMAALSSAWPSGPSNVRAAAGSPGALWLELGFQGNDPGTDLRGCGMLGVLQLLRLPELAGRAGADALYELSHSHEHGFPLAAVGLNLTAWALAAMRRGDLDSVARRLGSLAAAADAFYCGAWAAFEEGWRRWRLTMRESGVFMGRLERRARAQPRQLLAAGERPWGTAVGALASAGNGSAGSS